MANKINAIQAYGPRIVLGKTVQKRELVRLLSDRTGLNESEIGSVLHELRDAVIFYNRGGRGVKLEGLGTYLPTIKLNGRIRVSHRLDQEIKIALNTPREFLGEIINREYIGKEVADLVAKWNVDHPDDPIPLD